MKPETTTAVQAKIHGHRMRGLFSRMTACGVSPEELKARMAECISYARYDDRAWYSDVSRVMFRDLRANLIASKGDWSKAYEYMLDDAGAERNRAEQEELADNREERRHISHVRQSVLGL